VSFGASIAALVEQSDEPLVGAAKHWGRVPLGKIASVVSGPTWKSDYFNATTGIPLVRIRDVLTSRTDTKYSGPLEAGYDVKDGDLLVGMDGDFNANTWNGGDALLNQRVSRIRCDKKYIEPSYLALVLPGYLKLINDHTSSVTVKHLSIRTLAEIPLPLPPLAEQRRLVSKVDALSTRSKRARAELERVEALAGRARKAVLATAFDGTLTAVWRTKNPGAVLTGRQSIDERCRPATIQRLPHGWAWHSIGGIAEVGGGITKNSKRDQLMRKVPYLRVANVYEDRLDLSHVAEIGVGDNEVERTTLRAGDLLVVEGNGSIGQIGRVAEWGGEIDVCVHQNHIIRVRSFPEVCSRYLLYWMLSPRGRRAIESVAASTTGLHTLSLSKVAGLPVPLCRLEEQIEVIRRVEECLHRISLLSTEATSSLGLLNRLDRSILSRTFRGELVPQDPKDEPASVLLDRIRAEASSQTPKRRRRTG